MKGCKKKKKRYTLPNYLCKPEDQKYERERVLHLLLIFLVMPTGICHADCADFRNSPDGQYEPEDFQGIEYEPWELECCCFNNIITLVTYDQELISEGNCCGNQNVNCDTYKYKRVSAASPVETEGSINVIGPDGKAVESSAIPRIQEGTVCFCSDAPSTLCGSATGSGGILYTLECEECPE